MAMQWLARSYRVDQDLALGGQVGGRSTERQVSDVGPAGDTPFRALGSRATAPFRGLPGEGKICRGKRSGGGALGGEG